MKSIAEEMKNHFRSAISIVGATANKDEQNYAQIFGIGLFSLALEIM